MDFIPIYKDWLQNRKWAAKTELTVDQRVAMATMDNMKKRAWNSLSQTRRREIVEELVVQDVLPKSVLECMDIFDARVVGI